MFAASTFGIHSPVLYTDKDSIENQPELQYGMNFALAGSGVFEETGVVRNMTSQINNFKEQIDKKVYAEHDLENSVGLISNAGNDYGRYVKSHGNFKVKNDCFMHHHQELVQKDTHVYSFVILYFPNVMRSVHMAGCQRFR